MYTVRIQQCPPIPYLCFHIPQFQLTVMKIYIYIFYKNIKQKIPETENLEVLSCVCHSELIPFHITWLGAFYCAITSITAYTFFSITSSNCDFTFWKKSNAKSSKTQYYDLLILLPTHSPPPPLRLHSMTYTFVYFLGY